MDGRDSVPVGLESVRVIHEVTAYLHAAMRPWVCLTGVLDTLEFSLQIMASSLQINRLHPTFGAEIEGIDFSKPISHEQLTEIKDTVAQVGYPIIRQRFRWV